MLPILLAIATSWLTGADLAPPAAAPAIVVPLVGPDERPHIALVERAGGIGPESESFVGHLAGEPESVVVLSSSRGLLRGLVEARSGSYRVAGDSGGTYRMALLDEADRPGRPPIVIEDPGIPVRSSAAPPLDDGSELDLLVVYTPRAGAAAGGPDSIRALVQLGVTQVNYALEKSRAGTRVRLVHLEALDYEEAGDLAGDLELLQRDLDGAADRVHGIRDAYGADLVQLVVEEGGGCGIAYQMGSLSPAFESWAFSVVDLACVDAAYGVAHELAHNLGCDHAPEDVRSAGVFDYSQGYKDFAAGFRTIMAYGPGRRVGRFSNPRLRYRGQPLGAPSTDNTRSIRAVRRTVANFRPSLPRPTLRVSEGVEASDPFQRIEWDIDTSGVVEWWLVLGTRAGGRDLFDSGSLGRAGSVLVPTAMLSTGVVYARLWYRRDEIWLYQDVPLAAP